MDLTAVNPLADGLFDGPGTGARDPRAALLASLRSPDGRYDPLLCGRLLVRGRAAAEEVLPAGPYDAGRVVDEIAGLPVLLSGAEAVALLLASAGVEQVFAYAGTSELALCDAVHALPRIRLVNGRGDRESAFMAAGASLLRPAAGAAILHGARGSTNAAGALADARRCEAGTVFVVGLPSTGSARFLPPHGEAGLISTLSAFARWAWEAPEVPEDAVERDAGAAVFVAKLREAIARARQRPWGPVLFGVPQDVAEARWIPLAALLETATPPATATVAVAPVPDTVQDEALRLVTAARRPVILIDDYALRDDRIRPALDRFSRRTGAAVLQLQYRRGLMLFERLQSVEVGNFAGWLNPFSADHRRMLRDCDLLITVEDRNIYRRVSGDLPSCRKIAVNTDPAKVLKNEYLDTDDLLLEGDPAAVLTALSDAMNAAGPGHRTTSWAIGELRAGSRVNPDPPEQHIHQARRQVAGAIGEVLAASPAPALIDDSSMFGGLINEHYDDLPDGLRVFGGHGGFVGAGLSYAVGLALAEPGHRVVCTLGDQAFTNSFQSLVAAVQEQSPLLIVVCNNGAAVSLKKQAVASHGSSPRPYLDNMPAFDYCEVARAMGVPAERVAVPVDGTPEQVAAGVADLRAALDRGVRATGPSLVELVLPADPRAWQGIWIVQGFEQTAGASVG